MLISKKHKFIFIHVAKVAGQSVTNALMPYAANGWQRMIAPVFPYRYQLKLYSKIRKRCNTGYFYPQPLTDHARASHVLDYLGEARYREYYSFAFVRNPWARAVSIYTYALKHPRHSKHKKVVGLGSFEGYLRWHCGGGETIHQQRDYVCDSAGQLIVDFVGKQESLELDFGSVCEQLNLSAKLQHFNASRNDSYRDYYSDDTMQLVAEAYHEDIETFDYEF